MRPYVVLRYVGLLLVILSLFMLASAGVSLLHRDGSALVLTYSALVTLLFGIFPMVFVPPRPQISTNEGFLIVVMGWILCCLFGALPYILWAGEFDFTNACFESVSGFTTTGSSIVSEIEALPRGLIFWRAGTQWIGGLGILTFALAVLPAMNTAGLVIFRIETSSLARDSFRHNMRGTLRVLLVIYGGLTVAETIALCAAGMSLFDAVTHSFATIATGGFSSRNRSIAAYENPAIEVIVIVFMVLSGVHFGLLFSTVVERKATLWKSAVFRTYATMMALGSLAIMVSLHGKHYDSWPEALRAAAFQVTSVGTSTGFASADSSIWPPVAQVLLMVFALQCACAGSTSGGIKVDRVVLCAKAVVRQLRRFQYPHAVLPVRLDGTVVKDDTISAAMLYIVLYVVVVAIAGTLLITLGVEPLSAYSGTIATMGNVGPGLGSVGSLENFAHLPALGKWILSGIMLLGRLEIYGLLMLFGPSLYVGALQRGRS